MNTSRASISFIPLSIVVATLLTCTMGCGGRGNEVKSQSPLIIYNVLDENAGSQIQEHLKEYNIPHDNISMTGHVAVYIDPGRCDKESIGRFVVWAQKNHMGSLDERWLQNNNVSIKQ